MSLNAGDTIILYNPKSSWYSIDDGHIPVTAVVQCISKFGSGDLINYRCRGIDCYGKICEFDEHQFENSMKFKLKYTMEEYFRYVNS